MGNIAERATACADVAKDVSVIAPESNGYWIQWSGYFTQYHYKPLYTNGAAWAFTTTTLGSL